MEQERPAEDERREEPLATDAVIAKPLYLATSPDPVFAIAHCPSSPRGGATGVVLCPPLGWDELCTYRARRAWANALASSGHPAIRLDLPGTGDSAGSPREPARLAAWCEAVSAAAHWLRQETGCGRVAGLGIGFGGMLAWLAAANGAPIDDLMLWAVPTRGKRLLREMRAAALINIESHIEYGSTPQLGPVPPDGEDDHALLDHELLDQAGLITTRETSAALAQLDLTTLQLSHPARRRVLLFQRDRIAADQRVREYFEGAGAEVTVADGEDFGGMMRYVRFSETPHGAITQSLAWLSGSAPAPADEDGAIAGLPHSPVEVTRTLELDHDGVAIRERPITIELDSGPLEAILTEPVGVPAVGVTALFFNNGSDRRVGPNRMWVENARRWAALGVCAVRIDQRGLGDSDGDEDLYLDVGAFYEDRVTGSTISILDALQARGLPGRFVIVGFCSSAYWSLHAALSDARVVGTFAINLPFFFHTWWAAHVRNGWLFRRKRQDDDVLPVVAGLWTLKKMMRLLTLTRSLLLRARRRAPDRVDLALKRLSDRDTEVLLMFKPDSPLYEELLEDRRIGRVERLPHVQVRCIPGIDIRFRPLPLQRYVGDQLDAALTRLLEPGRRAASPEQITNGRPADAQSHTRR